MAEEKKRKEIKKLDDVKNTLENKAAIAKVENKVESKKEKIESKPAVKSHDSKKEKKVEGKIELEREYIVPLKRGVLKAPRYKRAKKAIRVLKEFLVKHMRVEGRDLRKVKIDLFLNNEIWSRGIKKPMNKIKVKAIKRDGIVYVELAEIPEAVSYKIARAEKRSAIATSAKVKTPKHAKEEVIEDKDKDGISDKVEEKEDLKAGAEQAVKFEDAAVKAQKHTAKTNTTKEDNILGRSQRKVMKR